MSVRDYYIEVDKKYIWHPYTKYSAAKNGKFPIIVGAKDIYLYDSEGNKYIDAISSWWCVNLGHGRKEITEAIKDQTDNLQHSILGNLTHIPAIELAKEIVELFGGNHKVFYASDGASSVEAALKISVQYWNNVGKPQKNRFVSLKDDYHGDTLGAIGVGFVESFHSQYKSVVTPSFTAEAPFCAACKYGKTPDTCNLECFSSMEKILNEHSQNIAAVIVEPLCQGSAGMRIYSPKYLKKLFELCKEKDVLFISDEIAMGFGRTGKMFAFEHAGIVPDITCIGKGLSGGYLPISAAVVNNRIFDTFTDTPKDNTFYHGHTFGGNPITCAAAIAVMDIYKRDNIVEKAFTKGEFLRKEFEKLTNISQIENIRTLGMIGAFDIKDIDLVDKVRDGMRSEGWLIRPLGKTIYFMLPLIVPESIISDGVLLIKNILR